ncbi:RES family NAD+ phosphorylase [Agrobacterium sp. MOPV5]|uniref:RES domain-containing protein n=1 Tax=Agrobacterium leguminum TaxID=2792015 RepID=UPI0018C2E7FD|nr:RES family NAD+ phosphorylase [Agrobacterium leguminum]
MTVPLPPPDLHSRTPEIVSLPAGSETHRFYTAIYEPIFFDRSRTGRFNAPDGSYGVLYVAKLVNGAFAETFLRSPGNTLIDAGFLKRKGYVRLETVSPLKLIDLTGPGLAIVGATAEIPHSGLPYDAAQAWSKALFDHPVRADGIVYHARHDDTEICYAIFDRAESAIVETSRELNLDQEWFWETGARYGVGLAP